MRFLRRKPGEQARPLDHDDAFPGFGRNGGGQAMALAYWQVAQAALRVLGLTYVD
jgi:hypothetical protein